MQAITFVTLCRLCGVPAQWQSGLYTKPDSAGHHDWARFYVAPFGWLFADCSFGGSAYRAGDLDRWNFYFGNLEPWRMPTCSAFQQEFNPPRRFLRYDPYDNQSGDVEPDARRLYADEYEDDCRVLRYENGIKRQDALAFTAAHLRFLSHLGSSLRKDGQRYRQLCAGGLYIAWNVTSPDARGRRSSACSKMRWRARSRIACWP